MPDPKVTVLMSVYNGEKYLKEAIDSILTQTFTDFEFLIINDASKDRSRDILQRYSDPRIKVITNEGNIGLTRSLNKGLRFSKGKYIARMDADDISMPERLKRQIEFMELHPDVGLLASQIVVIDINGKSLYTLKLPETNECIKWILLFENCIAHPAAFYRRDLAIRIGGYNELFKRSQDYDLWSRMSFETKIYQIPETLLKWRATSNYEQVNYINEQEETVRKVMKDSISKTLGKNVSVEQIDILRSALLGKTNEDFNSFFNLASEILNKYKTTVEISKEDKKLIYTYLVGIALYVYKMNRSSSKQLFGLVVSEYYLFKTFLYLGLRYYFRKICFREQLKSPSVWVNRS